VYHLIISSLSERLILFRNKYFYKSRIEDIFLFTRNMKNLLRFNILLEAPVKGWTQGGESDTPGVRTPTVLSCTSTALSSKYSTVLPLYSGSTGSLAFFPLVGL
jgi:hypothetical protein